MATSIQKFLSFQESRITRTSFHGGSHTSSSYTVLVSQAEYIWSKQPPTSETPSPQLHSILLHNKAVNTNIENIQVAH